MDVPARMADKETLHRLSLVRCIVVHHQVEVEEEDGKAASR